MDFLEGMPFGPQFFLAGIIERRRDRTLLRKNSAWCSIRATAGRVLDIGTEWSVGVCVASAGTLHFTPSAGIVGDRVIPVLALRAVWLPPELRPMTVKPPVCFIVTTPEGELEWIISREVSGPMLELLAVEGR